MRAAATRTMRSSGAERVTSGAGRSPRRAASSSSSSAWVCPSSASHRGCPTTASTGRPSSAASARLARRTRPSSSTSAMPSVSASNAVSHSSFAWRTRSKKRALASTTAACVASVESRRMSSGAKPPDRGSVTSRVPTVTPWACSGTAAAESAWMSRSRRVGPPPEWRTSSSLSPLSERASRPASSRSTVWSLRSASVPSAAATRSGAAPPPGAPAARATRAPRASRKRRAKRTTWSAMRSSSSESERT